jgi:hypothetical protein
MEFWSKKTEEISRTLHAQNPSKFFQNKSHSVLFWDQNWKLKTENNLRKWRVRYDWCQRRVADNTCRFLIAPPPTLWDRFSQNHKTMSQTDIALAGGLT